MKPKSYIELNLEPGIMKTEIIKIKTFVCMVVVLGLQALLQGSWRVPETQSARTKKGRDL